MGIRGSRLSGRNLWCERKCNWVASCHISHSAAVLVSGGVGSLVMHGIRKSAEGTGVCFLLHPIKINYSRLPGFLTDSLLTGHVSALFVRSPKQSSVKALAV